MKTSTHATEAAFGILGLVIIILLVAISVLIVTEHSAPDDVLYTSDSNLMAIENQLDYGLVTAPAESIDIIVENPQ